MSKLDHGQYLAGNVTNEFRLDIEFMQKIKWAEFLAKSCEKWLLDGHSISLKKFDSLPNLGLLSLKVITTFGFT